MMVNINNVIITTVASKAYDEINPKILNNYLIFTVVKVTLNMAEYATSWQSNWRSEQPKNVNFEPIIRGLKNDSFDWEQV